MDNDTPQPDLPSSPAGLFDSILQIGLIAALVYACGRILSPLSEILLWSAILAVMLYPLHRRLLVRAGERGSALLIGLVGIAVMLSATILVVTSLGSSVFAVLSDLRDQTLTVPPPPPRLADLPLIGRPLTEAWALAATNAPAALARYGPMLKRPAAWLLSAARRLAAGELSFVLSFAIAAILVGYGKGAAGFTRQLLVRATGSTVRGAELAGLAVDTIRGVAVGIVGVAVIQSLLLGAGFFVIRLPAAGLWTLVSLLLCIVQVPAVILTIPVIGYVFATHETLPALAFAVWTLGAGLSDNILKPLLLGRGLDVPMPVVLAGVVGGVMANGLLGLFIGPVVLATGYVLMVRWVRRRTSEDAQAIVSDE
ncbi:AI-2E family transporter [Methylobacterium currus]|uniref:AI-2E family transporter n=1 Tax=Methylobacterium currus TaxID=2051553 RepID=A0A2R4WNE2_9HYPH|nr:AI-2E family transporter [Methylobacterium currus]AWB23049.1 AI-2E family transporter [Methylobacterium currus]UHC18926.1 AI-2E family transporter [Methylobacterium currus]